MVFNISKSAGREGMWSTITYFWMMKRNIRRVQKWSQGQQAFCEMICCILQGIEKLFKNTRFSSMGKSAKAKKYWASWGSILTSLS